MEELSVSSGLHLEGGESQATKPPLTELISKDLLRPLFLHGQKRQGAISFTLPQPLLLKQKVLAGSLHF